ncbi:MAG: hypothetical protein KAY37_16560 [Phycisphaerae bacterium]|nr:hypothetical protein [Phycisphaerae bacterium]
MPSKRPPRRAARWQPAAPPATKPRRAPDLVAGVLILIAAGMLFLETKDCGLMGVDTYPIIISSRVQSCGELVGTCTEKLMDGRYGGDFYRPLLNLTFALDYALWELKPFGYQLTNLLLLAGCAAALYVLTKRAAGAGCAVASLAALVFFLLHPTHIEVLPVPARRPELLCCLLMALSLASQLSPRSLGRRGPPIWPAVFTLLAVAAKETALILPALAFLVVLLYSPASTISKRLRQAALALIPHAIALVVMLGARLAVLGGLGGHGATRAYESFDSYAAQVRRLLELLVFPQPIMQATSTGTWLLVGLILGLVLTAVLKLWFRPRGSTPAATDRRLVRAAVLALAWLVLVGLTYVTTGKIQPWYLLLLVAGLAMLVGIAAEAVVAVIRGSQLPARMAAVPTLILLGLLVAWQGRYSPLVCHYDEWERATAASHTFLDQLQTGIVAARDGTTLEAPPIPVRAMPRKDRPHIRGAAILMDYSVQAWAELKFPERRIRVRGAADALGDRPAADEVLVLLKHRMIGF